MTTLENTVRVRVELFNRRVRWFTPDGRAIDTPPTPIIDEAPSELEKAIVAWLETR